MAKDTGFPQGKEGLDKELNELKQKCAELEKSLTEAQDVEKKLKKKNSELLKKNQKLENKDIQEEYKDRVFKFIFGNPEHKKWTLSLYNAINGTQYTDEGMIRFNTIGDAVYMSMKKRYLFHHFFRNAGVGAPKHVQPQHARKILCLRREAVRQVHKVNEVPQVQLQTAAASSRRLHLLLQRSEGAARGEHAEAKRCLRRAYRL